MSRHEWRTRVLPVFLVVAGCVAAADWWIEGLLHHLGLASGWWGPPVLDAMLVGSVAVAILKFGFMPRGRRQTAREEMLRSLVANCREILVLVGADGKLLYLNQAFERVLGYPVSGWIGRGFSDLVWAEDLTELSRLFRQTLETPGTTLTWLARARHADGSCRWLEGTGTNLIDIHELNSVLVSCHDVTARRELDARLQTLSRAIEQSPASVIITNSRGDIEYVNPKFCSLTGYAPEEVLGRNPRVLKSGETPEAVYRQLWEDLVNGGEWRGELHNRKKNGELYWEYASISPILDERGSIVHFVAVKEDMTGRKRAEEQLARRASELETANQALQEEHAERLRVESELLLAQKLEAVGQMASGIAHEINTPMQYVGDSARFLVSAFAGIEQALDAYQGLADKLAMSAAHESDLRHVAAAVEQADLEYGRREIPQALEQVLEGVGRVTNIVAAMREFAHPGRQERGPADINHMLTTTLTIARNEYKDVAEIELHLGELAPVLCSVGEVNQAILNLLVNASHAVRDAVEGSGRKGKITLGTSFDGSNVIVEISDTGGGIPEHIRGRIFDPFFTTKAVGQGTGQGLAIARSIIVDRHGGSLTFRTESGLGTTFVIRLPLETGVAGREAA